LKVDDGVDFCRAAERGESIPMVFPHFDLGFSYPPYPPTADEKPLAKVMSLPPPRLRAFEPPYKSQIDPRKLTSVPFFFVALEIWY
jgi:hypothetical protein